MVATTTGNQVSVEPGVHPGVPDHEYHRWPFVSKSRLWRFKSLLDVCYTADDLREAMGKERPDSDALTFGRAFDDFLFYRDKVKDRYGVGPTKTRGTKAWLKEEAENPGVTLLTEDELERIPNMVDSILNHPLGGQLLQSKGVPQVSVVWDDDATNLRCKGRIDWWTTYEGMPAHVDLKTCRDLAWFNKDAVDFGYFLQSAIYRDGCAHIDRLRGKPTPKRRFLFLVVEKSASREYPKRHRVDVFEYDDVQIDSMLRMRDVLLSKWKRLYEKGEYPGDPPHVKQLHIPEHIENAYGDLSHE